MEQKLQRFEFDPDHIEVMTSKMKDAQEINGWTNLQTIAIFYSFTREHLLQHGFNLNNIIVGKADCQCEGCVAARRDISKQNEGMT